VQRAMQNFKQGDRVKAIVLAVHPEKKRIDFGIKPSFFTEEDFKPAADDESDVAEERDEQDEDGSDAEEDGGDAAMSNADSDEDDEVRYLNTSYG